jgi:hypothetical protein
MIDFDPAGLIEAVQETAEQVIDSVGESTLRAVAYAGADLFRDQAKQNALANKKTGVLFDSIIVKRLEEESSGGAKQVYLVTVRKGPYGGGDAFYWRWVENGHKFVPPNRNVSARTGRTIGWAAHRRAAELEYGTKRTRAYPFMRPAYETKKHEAVDLMTQTLAEQLARNAR